MNIAEQIVMTRILGGAAGSGDKGPAGDKGQSGDKGATGDPGAKGATGDAGATGGPGTSATIKHSATVGDGVNTSFSIQHGLNTTDVLVEIRETASPYSAVLADWAVVDANTVSVSFADPPTSNQYRVTVMG